MAVTKIWDIKGNVGKLLDYAGNTDKTSEQVMSDYTETDIQNMTDMMNIAMLDKRAGEFEHWRSSDVSDAINYAVQNLKTEERRYVTGINCTRENARDNMIITKRTWQKLTGNSGYHGYQAFRPGEVQPDIAHEIGVKLAERLWGDRFEVVVATHIDRGHIHNHFVLNSVSFVDGGKYNDCKATYMEMRKQSDLLCQEYGLSVVKNPEQGKAKHYSEWNAERSGNTTWRSTIKSDIDTAIRQSMTERQFFNNLKEMGYEIKPGKDISVRPPNKERFFRLQRNFGDDYAIESIRRRILAQTKPERVIINTESTPKKVRFNGVYQKPHRKSGLRYMYIYYCYRLGHFKKKQYEPSTKQIYFLYREDIRYLRRISEETRLLVKHKIDTDVQLTAHMAELDQQINIITDQRRQLRNKSRSIKDDKKLAGYKGEIKALTDSLKGLRHEVWLCEDIQERSGIMKEKIRQGREYNRESTQVGRSPQNQNRISR